MGKHKMPAPKTQEPNVQEQLIQARVKIQEQMTMIQQLSQPVVSVIIQYDPRANGVSVGTLGASITHEALIMVLQKAIEATIRDEQKKENAKQATPTQGE